MAQWYCYIGGVKYGPVDEATLRTWAAERRLWPNNLVWSEGSPDWVPASTVPNLFPEPPPSPAGAAGTVIPPTAPPPAPKSKLVAGLLGILVGYFGVHNFYLGYINKGIVQLLLTVLTCGILSPVSWVWGLIEGIMILTGSINTDAQGKPLVE